MEQDAPWRRRANALQAALATRLPDLAVHSEDMLRPSIQRLGGKATWTRRLADARQHGKPRQQPETLLSLAVAVLFFLQDRLACASLLPCHEAAPGIQRARTGGSQTAKANFLPELSASAHRVR